MIQDALTRRSSALRRMERAASSMSRVRDHVMHSRGRVRHLRRRWLGISGGSELTKDQARQLAHDALATGRLPRIEEPTAWAGRGTGTRCAVCSETISNTDTEFEVGHERAHPDCFSAWLEESRT